MSGCSPYCPVDILLGYLRPEKCRACGEWDADLRGCINVDCPDEIEIEA